MKKFLLLVTVCIALLALMGTAVLADDNTTFIFDNTATIQKWQPTGVKWTLDGGYGRFQPTNSDPSITLPFGKNGFDTSEYNYLAIKYKVTSTVNSCVYFVSTEQNPTLSDKGARPFPLTKDKWHNEIQDLNKNGYWKTGKITSFRLDMINGDDTSADILIDRIGFFKTEQEAKAFLGESNAENDPNVPSAPVVEAPEIVEPVTFVFDNEATIAKWVKNGADFTLDNGFGRVTPKTGDPYITHSFGANGFNTKDIRYFAIQYKITSIINSCVYFVATDTHPGMSDAGATPFKLTKDKWHGEILDLTKNSYWDGNIKLFRIDIINGDDPSADILIDRIGFFSTESEARAFLDESPVATSTIEPPVHVIDFGEAFITPAKSSNDCSITQIENYAQVVSLNGPDTSDGNGDPFAEYDVPLDENAQWIKMRIMNKSASTMFEMHFAPSAAGGITAESCTRFPVTANDTEFKEYIFNIKDYNAQTLGKTSVWKNRILSTRFDFMWISEPSGQVPTGSTMLVDYVAFFNSKRDAEAYVHTETEKGETITDYSDCKTFVFNNEDTIKQWIPHGSYVTFETGFARISPIGGDPYWTYQFKENEQVDASKARYLAIHYKANTTKNTGVYFVTSEKYPKMEDAGHRPFTVVKGDWHKEVIDLSANSHWVGSIRAFRLDIINGEDLNADILIERIGFFETPDQAYSFLADANTTPDYSHKTIIHKDMYTTIIPPHTLSESVSTKDFVLSNAGEKLENSVVSYTDASGNTSVVALGYTNSMGYATFVASKPGTYTITSNHKDYTDTKGHWGENYINFVSDRTLFGGTSPTEFSPDMPMTRGMFITVLGRMHGVDTSKYDGNTGYGDVPAAEYYAPYIQWAKENSIMAGLSDVTFAPEDPITRSSMAVVIKNYIDNSGFDFDSSENGIVFNDLAGLDSATVDAIKAAKNAGIINGKGNGFFDPNGSSTRAEVATVMERVIKSILGIPLKYNASFKQDSIMIGGWSNFKVLTEETIRNVAESGVDLIIGVGDYDSPNDKANILKYADKYNVRVTFHDYPIKYYESSADVPTVGARFYEYPSFYGHHIDDEPGSDDFEKLDKIADQYRETYPGKVPFYNLLPMYANAAQLKYGAAAAAIQYYDSDPNVYKNYLEEYAKKIDTHYICVDIYPFKSQNGIYAGYCRNLDIFGTVCRENNRDFWLYIQSQAMGAGQKIPTAAEFRWQMYCGLSFGVKTFIHFTYGSYDQSDAFAGYSYSLINDDGSVTPTYYEAQKANNEMHAISDVYVQYKNMGAFSLNHSDKTPYLDFDNQYESDIFASIEADKPLLVGCFDEKNGSGKAFTLVNMENVFTATAATVTFKPAKGTTVTAYPMGIEKVLTPDANGVYTITIDTQGVFVTVK